MIARKCLRLIVLMLLLLPGAAQAEEIASKAEALMNSQVAHENFSGAVLVAQDSQIVFEQGYGLANRDWMIPNRPDTRVRYGYHRKIRST